MEMWWGGRLWWIETWWGWNGLKVLGIVQCPVELVFCGIGVCGMGMGQMILMAAGVVMMAADMMMAADELLMTAGVMLMAAGVMMMAAGVMLMAAGVMLMAAGVMLMAAGVMMDVMLMAAGVMLMAGGVMLMAAGVMLMAAGVMLMATGVMLMAAGVMMAADEMIMAADKLIAADELSCPVLLAMWGWWLWWMREMRLLAARWWQLEASVWQMMTDYAWVWQMDPVNDCDDEMEVTGKMGLVWKASPLSLHMIVWESLLTPTVSYKFHGSSLLANAHVLLLNLSWKCTRISPPEIMANSLAFTIKDFFRSFRRFHLGAVSGSKAITHGPEWRGGALALFEVLKKNVTREKWVK